MFDTVQGNARLFIICELQTDSVMNYIVNQTPALKHTINIKEVSSGLLFDQYLNMRIMHRSHMCTYN